MPKEVFYIPALLLLGLIILLQLRRRKQVVPAQDSQGSGSRITDRARGCTAIRVPRATV